MITKEQISERMFEIFDAINTNNVLEVEIAMNEYRKLKLQYFSKNNTIKDKKEIRYDKDKVKLKELEEKVIASKYTSEFESNGNMAEMEEKYKKIKEKYVKQSVKLHDQKKAIDDMKSTDPEKIKEKMMVIIDTVCNSHVYSIQRVIKQHEKLRVDYEKAMKIKNKEEKIFQLNKSYEMKKQIMQIKSELSFVEEQKTKLSDKYSQMKKIRDSADDRGEPRSNDLLTNRVRITVIFFMIRYMNQYKMKIEEKYLKINKYYQIVLERELAVKKIKRKR